MIVSGLAVELATLFWNHPVSFFLFVVPGAALMSARMLLYLWSAVTGSERPGASRAPGLVVRACRPGQDYVDHRMHIRRRRWAFWIDGHVGRAKLRRCCVVGRCRAEFGAKAADFG